MQNLLPTILAQVGNQGDNQGINKNQNDDAVNDTIQGGVRNVIRNNSGRGCSYKEFLACNLKEYDEKGGAVVYTRWIEKMESVQDMNGCSDDQKVKYTAGSFVDKALMWWNSQIHARSQEVAVVHHLVTPESKKIERYVYGLTSQIWVMVAATELTIIQKAGTLTNEAIRNRSLKKNPKKRGNGGEPSRDRNVKDNNKRTRTRNAFAMTANPMRREYTGTLPKCINYNLHYPPESLCRVDFNYNRLGHFAKDCRALPRMVNLVNVKNPTTAPRACFKCGGADHIKAACPRLNQA
ncbi:reverse transcriptase domain-containing protein [Tanacetum coccineum]